VPVDMVVGKENAGWKLITLQLNHERIGLAAFSNFAVGLYHQIVDWARETESEDGRPVADKPWVQMALAEAFALLEAMKVVNWRMAWELEYATPDPARSSAAKVFSTEAVLDVYRLFLEVLGSVGTVKEGSKGAVLQGNVEHEVRLATVNTFGGGVNEIQRELVAMLGLRMPRAAR
jgi:alkylation response protein AidB-like acyl-CoA dehydrogenase